MGLRGVLKGGVSDKKISQPLRRVVDDIDVL